MVRPTPETPQDWHAALAPHVRHELAVRSGMEPLQLVEVACVADDGRASLSIRPDGTPAEDAQWRPHVSAPLFFAGRSVGCRTCQQPLAR
ncbi:hypothetical protein [Streptomyces sp. TRM68367]|uniref:hypothetical protein n=1 Tax=Streptomyces sp. TRM68367 TaxID=2758415 RepID=UPI00165B2841|nr:hypothetical protein [Streptomyces sp. TRM68367]MBC9730703.1 hypothetical protein [Streptomyces sp. TRM68367]